MKCIKIIFVIILNYFILSNFAFADQKIKFVDIDSRTLNVKAEEIIKNVTKKTKVILIINVLGLSTDIEKIRKFCKMYYT